VKPVRFVLVVGLLVLPAFLATAQGPDLQLRPLPAPDVAGAVASGAAGGASSITLKVPVELTRIPAGIRQAVVVCNVGVGAVSGATTWTRDTIVGGGSSTINLPNSAKVRNHRGTVSVEIATTNPARTLKDATHYSCRLTGVAGQPAIAGDGVVTGAIRKP
jgi:hypothetical protein